ncbi:MAG: tetratricopeptide repeat protein [Bacteroidota bacterium]|nr:tetratricopeptide repeat protein [Bacteroidota bacterium]
MENARITALLQMLEEEPNDAFTIYALALEYAKTDTLKSMEYFAQLLQKHPDYVSTYYQYGQLLWESNNQELAMQILKKGMEVAAQQKDTHALAELKSSLMNKEMGLEDE